MKLPPKPKRTGFGEFSQLVNLYRLALERGQHTGEDLGALRPVPISCPIHLLRLDVPELYSFIINQLMPKAQLLCTKLLCAELNLGDRVYGELEKDSFIALPGKAGPSGLLPRKTVCPNREAIRSLVTILPKGVLADNIRVCAG